MRSPRLLAAVAVWILLVAGSGTVVALTRGPEAGPATPAPPAPPTTGAPTPSTPTDPAPAGAGQPLSGELATLMAQVAELRGLAWLGPLDLRVVARDDMVRELGRVVARDRDPAELAAAQDILGLLELIPRDADYERIVDDLLSEQVLGFYDQRTGQLFVGAADPDDLDPATKLTVVHEMVHALTDQHFGFGARDEELEADHTTETAVGLSALAEGDAVTIQRAWAARYLSAADQLSAALGSGGSDEALSRAPAYVRRSLFFPYTDGVRFVAALRQAGGQGTLDAAYRDLPATTEQILHPERFLAGEGPRPVAPPPVSGTGCSEAHTGLLGEYDLAALLDDELPAAEADDAAEGWGGDAFRLLRCAGAPVLAGTIVMDGPEDAADLARAFRSWASGWSGGAVGPDGRFAGPGGAGWVGGETGRLDYVLALDAATRDRVAPGG